jgi:hypothetical protein
VDYTSNWLQAGDLLAAKNSSARQASGILELYTRSYFVAGGGPGSTVYAPGKITLRSRRVFTSSFTSSISLNHIGGGLSTISLKKALDDSTVLSLSVNNGPGQNSVVAYPPSPATLPTANGFTGWHQISFVKKDAQVFLMIDGNSKSYASANVMDGYYLEFDSQGDNILQVKDLSVVRTASVISSLPTFTFSPSQSQSVVTAGKSVDFAFSLKSNNGYAGKVTVEPFGLPIGAYSTAVNVDIASNQTINGKFTVSTSSSLKVGNYNFTVTATGSGFRSDPVMQTLSVRGTASIVAPPTGLTAVAK